MKTPKKENREKVHLIENINKYKEYFLIKDNIEYRILIINNKNEIILKHEDYEIKFNTINLSFLTKKKLNTLDESFAFIINLFDNNKVIIKNIIIKKAIILIFNILNFNQETSIEIVLSYNKDKEKNEILNNEINNNNVINLEGSEDNKIPKKYNNNLNNECNINKIKFIKELTKDSFSNYYVDNTFTVFKSINEILYLIYANNKNSIISYDLVNSKKILEIKNAHGDYITYFRYCNDLINKRDLIISTSSNNIKLWNVENFNCLLNIIQIYKYGNVTACFLKHNNKINIIAGNFNIHYYPELIRVYDLNGNTIKKLEDSNDSILFIDSYYDNKSLNTYIIAGNSKNYCKSYDYNTNKMYKKYIDINCNETSKNRGDDISCESLIISNEEDLIKLISSCIDGYIRIWNFHSGELLNKIIVIKRFDALRGICLWNNNYLFVGCHDKKIKLIDLKKGVIIKNLKENKNFVLAIKKIVHPLYGECLISQGVKDDQIKMWNL